ncbi:alpha-amylase family glycosyl hydrolase [Psychrosphaera haliotis]|uniref:alpha-amylase family glycosyl hydrolase n=1 Tax=Psychrosphaera haliotis TaxID=555083 RepID=UPI00236BFFD8|nr:alpha-amylase family glycosyl hydrolase [Psychrosphaera haliotis]
MKIKQRFSKSSVISLSLLASLVITGCNNPNDSANESTKSTAAKSVSSVQIKNSDSDNAQQSENIQFNGEFSEHYLTRDVRDDVFYFVMPDRFDNGDMSNDNGSKTIAESAGGFDKTSNGHYHGGDIKGLTKRLDYLKGLGISAIWLTPILRNQAVQGDSSGYHGYWPLDFTEIDPHLGTNADLKEFIDAAHAKNMKVFFDIITNHTADVIKYEECHGENKPQFSTSSQLCEYISLADKAAGKGYTPFIPKGHEDLKTPAWLNDPKFYHNQGDSTWQGENSVYGDFMGLDDVDTDNPEVVKGMTDIFNNLITEFKPDGFRIDTVKHVNMEFWQQFTPAIIEHAKSLGIPKFFVFGEVYSGDPKELSKFTTEGDIPSVLDFAFQYRTKDVFAYDKGTDNLQDLFSNDHLYNDHNSSADYLMNFVSNHDVGRLAYTLDQSLPEASEEEKIKRFLLSNSLMYFARGIPVLYYGDEQGFTGDGGDRGAREDMMPSLTPDYNDNNLYGTNKTTADDNFDVTHPIYQSLAEYAAVYHQHEVLRKGKQEVIEHNAEPGVLALSREIAGQPKYVVVYNSSTTSKVYKHNKAGDVEFVLGEAKVTENQFELAPLSFVIFKSK